MEILEVFTTIKQDAGNARRPVRRLQRAAHHLLWRCPGQRTARRAAEGGRLFLPGAPDQLATQWSIPAFEVALLPGKSVETTSPNAHPKSENAT